MPESRDHSGLVQLLLASVDLRHGSNDGLCVYCDAGDRQTDSKPRRINGYVPDVFVVTVPTSLTVIGEAKVHRDLVTPHSQAQMRAFLRFLRYSPDPYMLLAVPVAAAATAFGLLERLRFMEGAENVQTQIITPAAWANGQQC
jgi:hypothetical protein